MFSRDLCCTRVTGRGIHTQGETCAGSKFPNGKPETEANEPMTMCPAGKPVVLSPPCDGNVPASVHRAGQGPREVLTQPARLGGQSRDLPLLPTAPLGRGP